MLESPVEELRKLLEENEEHRKIFAEIFLALGTDETDRTKWAGMIREMKQLLKTIYETDCLPHWAYERDVVDEESIAEMVRRFIKEPK